MNSDLSAAQWFKSTRSGSGKDCVEAAHLSGGSVWVRDSKLGESSPVLKFRPAEWDAFTAALQAGKFDQS
ncbi:DUF397 domain-containing protein [Nocardia sp. NPDC006630]|uniref:DUF397 domain-containing protein n=1 Tax=Nocardia sp. NPDC006630 TaxID=3157181 RepID=UPI0033B39657